MLALPSVNEGENQYEVSICVKDESTNLCRRHGSTFNSEHQCGAYTLMNGSIGSPEHVTDNYSLAIESMPNEDTSDRSYSVPNLPIFFTTSSRRASEMSVNARPYYSTVIPRPRGNNAGDTYEFAGDFQQNRLSRVSPQLSIPPLIPELPQRINGDGEQSKGSKFHNRIKHRLGYGKEGMTSIVLVLILVAFLTGFVAILMTTVLYGKVTGIEDNLSFLKELIGAPSSSSQALMGCNNGNNVCHPLGGVCVGTNFGYGCFCKDGWTGDGQNCTEITYSTCTALRNVVGFTTGYYEISPEKVEPLVVKCDMQREKGVTEIGHDSEQRGLVNGCNPAGCYSKNVTYDASMMQIEAIIKQSNHCSQYIKYECYHSSLRYGWWVSRIGTKETRWAEGVAEHSCACSLQNDNDCPGCHCNRNDSKDRMDEGYITNKTLLPIIQLRFGDVGNDWEVGYFTLGKLKCYD